MRKCTVDSTTCATTGTFTAVVLTDGAALPAWITTTTSSTKIAIAPTTGTVKAGNNWVIKVTYTPTKGSNQPVYTAVTITVSCEITSFTVGNPGTTSHTYNTFDKMKIVDASSLTYTQVPACGYTFTKSFAYTIPSGASNAVSQGAYLTPSFNVHTSSASITGSFTLTVTNTITVTSGQGQSTVSFGSLA